MNIDGVTTGIVLDHIDAGKSLAIYNLLRLDKLDCSIAIIQNAKSGKYGKKDIIKIDQIIDLDFDLIVFDPPHLIYAGENSWLAKKYGKLDKKNWPEIILKGFNECNRVLSDKGTLIFKWNDSQIHVNEILKIINRTPLFGDKRGKTRWLVVNKIS